MWFSRVLLSLAVAVSFGGSGTTAWPLCSCSKRNKGTTHKPFGVTRTPQTVKVGAWQQTPGVEVPLLHKADFTFTNKTLGDGMNGDVVLIRHNATGAEYAYKFLPDDGEEETQLEKRVAAKMMGNPRIVTLKGVIQEERSNKKGEGLVLEFVSGGELLEHALGQKRGSFTEEVAFSYFRQMLDAVEALHKQGIGHRDLKLENFLFVEKDSPKKTLKLIDFGLATEEDARKTSGATYDGSASYVAPEALRRGVYSPKKGDIWSLGVLLFMLTVGAPPFAGSEGDVLLRNIQRMRICCDSKNFQKLSVGLKNLLLKELLVKEEERAGIEEIRKSSWYQRMEQKEASDKLGGARNKIESKNVCQSSGERTRRGDPPTIFGSSLSDWLAPCYARQVSTGWHW